MDRLIAIGVAAAAAIAAIAALTLRGAREIADQKTVMTQSAATPVGPATVVAPANGASGVQAPNEAQRVSEEKAKATSLAGRFASASNYRDFASSILDAAKAGGRDEQYYLFQALDFCATGYRIYFDRGNRRRTLDEAMQWATRDSTFTAEEARQVYDKCHTLMEKSTREHFGSTERWLSAATKAGHPAAQAISAHRLFNESLKTDPNSTDLQAEAKLARERREAALHLLEEALKGNDPQALWTIGELQPFLVGSDAPSEEWIWRLAACQRGFDCSENAPWYKIGCRFDPRGLCQPGENGIDYIRREAGLDFPAYEQKARELNAKLDAGAWDQIDLTKGLGG